MNTNTRKTNVIVLYGGKSVEHDVSLQSALAVINGFNREMYNIIPVYISREGVWRTLHNLPQRVDDVHQLCVKGEPEDRVSQSLSQFLNLLKRLQTSAETVVFPVLHGTNGEDGTVQGLLEVLQVPYVGNGVLASSICIDKVMTKEILARAYIPQAEYVALTCSAWQQDQGASLQLVKDQIDIPCYVKPARLGSSIGVSRCDSLAELREALPKAFQYDDKVVVEKEISGREMQVAVLGNDQPQASVVGEYIKERAFMDYQAKYIDGRLVPVIPARLSSHLQQVMQEMALRAFKALNASGLLRVDFFVTDRNDVFVNEVNTLPGFTTYSMFPSLWEKTNGITYSELLDKLIRFAFERQRQKEKRTFTRCSND